MKRPWLLESSIGVALVCFVVLLFSFPAYAASDVYVSPDQVLPSTTQVIEFQITNNNPWIVDDIVITPPGSTGINFVSGSPTPYSVSSTRVEFGHWCTSDGCSLRMGNGQTMNVRMTVTTGTTLATGNWGISEYQWNNSGSLIASNTSLSGNIAEAVTNVPDPTVVPSSVAQNNSSSDALNSAGIGDPVQVKGLLAPGPVDSILLLPVDALTAVISEAGISVVPLTFSFFGTVVTLQDGAGIYSGLGTTFTTVFSALICFFLVYVWIESLYHRLQRATSLQTHESDTWGVL